MKLDLNLLMTLSVLLEENSVSRTAERLNLSQPSVSARLDRLRKLLDDPLLVPTSHGMRPTARAESLRLYLQQLSTLAETIVSPIRPFSPLQDCGQWRIAATDYGGQAVLTPSMNFLRESAPGMKVVMIDLQPDLAVTQLEKGDTDLIICQRAGAPEGLHIRSLFHEHYVLAGRSGHPDLKPGLSIEQYCELEHVVVSPEGGGLVGIADTILHTTGMQRNVVLSLPHFMLMATILAETNLVAMIPEKLALRMPGLSMIKPPITIPGFEIVMLWHERQHRDTSHQWLRNTLYQHVNKL